MRTDRKPDELRPIKVTRGYTEMTPGSVLIEMGRTRVLCTVSLDDDVPPWMRDSGKGWVTAEYAMLPTATSERMQRESVKGKLGGRTYEIQRLIGRSLRGVVDTAALGEKTVVVDCDVIQADGGTRCASITGGYVALMLALKQAGLERAITSKIAAISVGLIEGQGLLDLEYREDSSADVDFNVIGTDAGTYVELQGTAEGKPFDRAQMDELLGLADNGLKKLFEIQDAVLAGEAAKAAQAS